MCADRFIIEGTMNKERIIVSMTTWPPRWRNAIEAMADLQHHTWLEGMEDKVHLVLVLSREEFPQHPEMLISSMEAMNVEIIWDEGNIKSHKKLMPTLEKYPDNPILVVDDDVARKNGWLTEFVREHEEHPEDIIYGYALSRVYVEDGNIVEDCGNCRHVFSTPGQISTDFKPSNGGGGTLYPAGTFTDPRFFDRELFMKLSPTSDETWQFAFAKIAGRTFRCLGRCNYPLPLLANQEVALWETNKNIYSDIHNRIAEAIPEYLTSLIQ